MLKDKLVVLTEEEFEALEAREQRITELEKRLENVYVDASGALCVAPPRQEAAPSTPDFAAMDPDDLSLEEVQALRDWLDERGRRCVWEFPDGWLAELTRRGESSGERIGVVHEVQPSEPAALLALCQAVAAEEAS